MQRSQNTNPNRRPQESLRNGLRQARLARQLTRKQVARIIGVSHHLIGAYERALHEPSVEMCLSLQILYREQIASLYNPLYRQLVDRLRTAEATVLGTEWKAPIA